MQSGRLDRLVTIQHIASSAPDAAGQVIATWGPLATVWAERRDQRSREFFAAKQINAEIAAVYRIRWRSDITTLMRLVDGAVTYEIVGPPVEIGRRQGLDLMLRAIS